MGKPDESFRDISDPTTERTKDKRLLSYFTHNVSVLFFSTLIQSIFAAAIPGLSVLILYKVHNIQDRIILLIGLTVIFATIVKLIRMTREVDIFSVTAG
jgi:inner membrane protein involved in colicin E2 resistance